MAPTLYMLRFIFLFSVYLCVRVCLCVVSLTQYVNKIHVIFDAKRGRKRVKSQAQGGSARGMTVITLKLVYKMKMNCSL